MRVEYKFGLEEVDIPRFSVETTEGPGKLFTLSTLILNVLPVAGQVDIIFHSPNREDLPKKIHAFNQILLSAPRPPQVLFESGDFGSLGSSYYQWLSIRTKDAAARGSAE